MSRPGPEPDKKASRDPVKLRQHELFWQSQYDFLKSKGYQLRPRYQNKTPTTKAELLELPQPNVMDAIRVSDSLKVCLKVMKPLEINHTRDASVKHRNAQGNRAVKVLNFIPIPESEDSIAVLPYLREFDDPHFTTLGEVLTPISQFVEAIEFLHTHGIAHRDACWRNLMMDASELIPKGWHFARPWTEDGFKPITYVPRSTVKTNYYLIDFGLAVIVDDGTNPLAIGIVGQDRTVPEFQAKDQTAKYDPFKLDIYQLGNTFKTRLLERYDGLDCLEPLVAAMTSEVPSNRPSASKAREMVEELVEDANASSNIRLKPGVRVWGSNPPGGPPSRISKVIDTMKDWLVAQIAHLAAIRDRWF